MCNYCATVPERQPATKSLAANLTLIGRLAVGILQVYCEYYVSMWEFSYIGFGYIAYVRLCSNFNINTYIQSKSRLYNAYSYRFSLQIYCLQIIYCTVYTAPITKWQTITYYLLFVCACKSNKKK